MLGGKLADYPSSIGPIGRAVFYLGFWPFLGLVWLMAALSFVGLFLVVQILRLVPVDSAGQTAGIDPKRTVVATDSMSRIDVGPLARLARVGWHRWHHWGWGWRRSAYGYFGYYQPVRHCWRGPLGGWRCVW
jgi:hypothetical protein